ncbi:hypothetical protein ACKKBF_B31420 [Auxenochlorella protothecoides x Auxenochlorella symbiontica]
MRWRLAAVCGGGLALLGGAAASSLAEAQHPAGDTLELVQVVFRHGARTPLSQKYWPELVREWDACGQAYTPVPLDIRTEDGQPRPANPDDVKQVETRFPGGCSKGELTRLGQRQALAFGRWLRRRYVDTLGFLPGDREQDTLLPRTTNYARTVATLAGVLTGLYPGDEGPVPALTTPEMDEVLYANVRSCARLKELVGGLHAEARASAKGDEGVQALGRELAAAMGLPPGHRVSWLNLHDALTSMQAHDKPIPEGVRSRPDLLLALDRQAVTSFLHVVAPPHSTGRQEEVLRLGMGRMLRMLEERMEETVAGTAKHRMLLYSGHDSTLMPLLVALGKEVETWPAYMSNLVFENWRRGDGQRYVKVLYNGEALGLQELCGTPECPLQDFRRAVMAPLQLDSATYAEECVVHPKHTGPAGTRVETRQRGVSIGSSMQEEDE